MIEADHNEHAHKDDTVACAAAPAIDHLISATVVL
jgi:hypothetical protein